MKPLKEYRSSTYKQRTGCGSLYTTIVVDDDLSILTVICNLGKSGGCAQANTELASRLLTQALENGADPKELVKQLRGLKCNNPGYQGADEILSCSDAIGRSLEEFIES